LASLLFAAHALTGLRKRGDYAPNMPTPDELGCPSLRFPTLTRCRVLMGPCKAKLAACDAFYAKPGALASYTDSVRRRFGKDKTPVVKATEKCEMATCLAQCGPGEDSQVGEGKSGVIVGPGRINTRTANEKVQPKWDRKGEDQIATLCSKEFMKLHATDVDKALMTCVQHRVRTVAKRPHNEVVTTTPAPGPANWFCVPSMNFDRRGGRDIKKQVFGPFLTVDLAKKQLDSTWGSRQLEQFICEIRVANKYTTTIGNVPPPLMRGNVTQTPWLLGAVATTSTANKLYIRPSSGWGADTAQTIANNFNIGCKVITAPVGTVQTVETCPNLAEMLAMCNNDYTCNPIAWR